MEPFIAQITPFGFNWAVRGWALCNGQLLPIAQNSALFSLIGTIYGGDGRTTFGLPDLRGRVPVHYGNGPGLASISIGQRGGANTTTEVPAHSHSVSINTSPDTTTTDISTGNYFAHEAKRGDNALPIYSSASPTAIMNPNAAVASSSGVPGGVNNMQPFTAICYQIALTGIFPSRS